MPLRQLLHAVRHPLSQNAAALYAAQLALMVLPLVTLPWLARALGPTELGLVIFVQSMSSLVGIPIGYGFNLSSTRLIARQRGDREAMGGTVADVLGAQLLLIGVTGVGSLLALLAVPEFRADPRLPLFGWVMGALQGLNPTWFLMGLERIRLQAFTEVTVRTLQAVAIILLVKDEGDVLLVLWIWLLGNGVVTGILGTLMYRQVPARPPALSGGVEALRRGWALFVTQGSTSLYTSGTVFVLGLIVSTAQLGIFAAAERIARAALRASAPLGTVTYPRVNYYISGGQHDEAQRLATLTLAARFAIGFVSAALLIALAPWLVVVLLGSEFEESGPILRILALLIPIFAVTSTLSAHWLLSHGHDRITMRIAIAGGMCTLVLTAVMASVVGIVGVAWSLVAVQVAVAASLAFIIRRVGIGPGRGVLKRNRVRTAGRPADAADDGR